MRWAYAFARWITTNWKNCTTERKKQETIPKNVPYDELKLVGNFVYDALSDKLKRKIEARDFDDTDIVN